MLRLGFPSYSVEAIQGSISELSVELPSSLNDGLAQGESAELALTLTPSSAGPKELKLLLFTNDPDQPEIEVMVRATAEALPPCAMTVAPAGMLRMSQAADGGAEGIVTFTNTGMTPCLLDDVRIMPGSYPSYAVTAGGVLQVEIPRGGSHVVNLEAGGPQPVNLRVGWLGFHVFNRDSSDETVSIYSP